MISAALAMLETDEQRNILSEFYEENKNRFYSIAYARLHSSEEAEDAVQETFLRIVKYPNRFFTIEPHKRLPYAVIIIRNIVLQILEEKGKYSMLEMILVFTIIALILGTAIMPAIKKARESTRKVQDISIAKTIHNTIYEGLLIDKIEYPEKDIFIVVEKDSEVSPGLNAGYRKSVLNYLHDNMIKVPYETKFDETKKFLIKINIYT